jgi:hypothetical protein
VLPIFYVTVMGAVLVNMFVTEPVHSLSALGLIVVGAVVYVVMFSGRAPERKPEREPVNV